jgi:hypothetical protein
MFYAGENVCTNPGRRTMRYNFPIPPASRGREKPRCSYIKNSAFAIAGSWHSLPGHVDRLIEQFPLPNDH